jgi:hypothetical protein
MKSSGCPQPGQVVMMLCGLEKPILSSVLRISIVQEEGEVLSYKWQLILSDRSWPSYVLIAELRTEILRITA